MGINIFIESLRFYRLRAERLVRLLFLVLLGLAAAAYLLPYGDRDFSSISRLMEGLTRGQILLPRLTAGNWLILAVEMLLLVFARLVALFYANQLVVEQTAPEEQAWQHSVKAVPGVLVMLFLEGFILTVSSLLLAIPYFIFISSMLLVPLLLSREGQGLAASMQHSYRFTRGAKLFILLQLLFLRSASNLIEVGMHFLAGTSFYAEGLVGAFIYAWSTLCQGRMMGLFYLLLTGKPAEILKPGRPGAA